VALTLSEAQKQAAVRTGVLALLCMDNRLTLPPMPSAVLIISALGYQAPAVYAAARTHP
jgi:hypothetical protein